MNLLHNFLFSVYPYICLSVFLMGSLARFDRDQYTWKSDSSQLLRKGQLKWGSNLFHAGILFRPQRGPFKRIRRAAAANGSHFAEAVAERQLRLRVIDAVHFAEQSQVGDFDRDDQGDRLGVSVESRLDVRLDNLNQIAGPPSPFAADAAVSAQFLPEDLAIGGNVK